VNKFKTNGVTSLHIGAQKCHLEVVKNLLLFDLEDRKVSEKGRFSLWSS